MALNQSTLLDYDSIFLRLVDLEISHDRKYTLGAGQSLAVTSAICPAKLLPIAPFQHWAIQVRDNCYEVTEDEEGMIMRGRPEHGWFVVPEMAWVERCNSKKLNHKIMKVGATRRSDAYIKNKAKRIWEGRFETKYLLGSQNCQNFAELLFYRIKLSAEEVKQVPWREQQQWKSMPRRITQLKTLAKKVGPYLSLGVGLDAAFLTLRAVNPVANVVIGTAIGATLVIPAVFAKSKDHKWKKKMKKADKMIAAMEFADGKQISDPSLDSYQGYNKESVDAIAESTNSSVNDVVWALQCFRLSTYDGKPFNVSGEDWNFMVEALQQTE